MNLKFVSVSALTLMASHFAFGSTKMSAFYDVAKQKCHDISCIRTEMDRINNEILELLAERTAYVSRAGDLKARTTKIADDRKRVADQEKKITEKSVELELPIEISVPSFRTIMETSIKYQQSKIDEMTRAKALIETTKDVLP